MIQTVHVPEMHARCKVYHSGSAAQNIAMSGVNELSIDDIRQVTHQQDPPCLPDPQDQLVLPYLHHQAYHQKVYVAGAAMAVMHCKSMFDAVP